MATKDGRVWWPIDRLKPDPNQPRKIRNEEYIKQLSENIERVGLINAIEVTEGGKIITGEMRYRAAKLAGWKEVPVRVLDPDTIEDVTLRQVSENVHREPQNPVDTARLFAKTKAERNWNYSETAEHFGLPLGTMKGMLSILGLPEFALDAVGKGKISWPTAAVIAPMKDPDHIKWMVAECSSKRIRNTRIAQLIQRYLSSGGDFEKAKELVAKTPTESQAYNLLDAGGFSSQVRSNLKIGNRIADLATELMLLLKATKVETVPPVQLGRILLTLTAFEKEKHSFQGRAKTLTAKNKVC